jgi:molybdopterin molybdotransferase
MNVRPGPSASRDIDDCLSDCELLAPTAARELVLEDVHPISGTELCPLPKLLGRVTYSDCCSAVELPRFDNSAVDGYGIHADDLSTAGRSTLAIVGRAAAGRPSPALHGPGTAVRILTGARVPSGVAAIVLEERTTRVGSSVLLHAIPQHGANIRRRGEDVSIGSIVVKEGTRFDCRHMAILAASGIVEVSVLRRLRIGVLSTGDELVEAGHELGESAIVDTNRPMLLALLASSSIEILDLGIVADERNELSAAIATASQHLDLLITSGGVAGSDADHLEPALHAAGGTCKALKLALRPGKPIAKGRVGEMHVLALPGNPVAALVNFLLFGRPMIECLLGAAVRSRSDVPARAAEVFGHKAGRTEFVPVRVIGHDTDGTPQVEKLGRGGSARLLPLVTADGFAEIGAASGDIQPNTLVSFHPFSTSFAL